MNPYQYILEGVSPEDRRQRAEEMVLTEAATDAQAVSYYVTAYTGRKATSVHYILGTLLMRATRLIWRPLIARDVGPNNGVPAATAGGLSWMLEDFPAAETEHLGHLGRYKPRAKAYKAILGTMDPLFAVGAQALERIEYTFKKDELTAAVKSPVEDED